MRIYIYMWDMKYMTCYYYIVCNIYYYTRYNVYYMCRVSLPYQVLCKLIKIHQSEIYLSPYPSYLIFRKFSLRHEYYAIKFIVSKCISQWYLAHSQCCANVTANAKHFHQSDKRHDQYQSLSNLCFPKPWKPPAYWFAYSRHFI